MRERLFTLLATLMRSTSFEQAAGATLRAMMDEAGRALAVSPYGDGPGKGVLVRGMVHLRPTEGYRRLAVLEAGSDEVTGRPGMKACLPSTTAWRLVAERGCAVSVDVGLRQLRPYASGPQMAIHDRSLVMDGFPSEESRQRLLDRETTHMHVVPLRTPGGAVDGMITLEADCTQAAGLDFIWGECAEALQLLCDAAAPYLSMLPVREAHVPPTDEYLPVIGASMANLVNMLGVFARQEETLLLCGPTGTGKSRMARWCHENSRRRQHPFQILDLMTVPEDLQMGELFGWKKGAFTGAVRDNPGCVLLAEHGTLFIDEIDKLSLRAQAGLLYMLETHRYRVLGDVARERPADVRFIVGTNANLQAAVRAGRFREDLYYRVNVLPVNLPPLSERRDEIALWAEYMVRRRHRDSRTPPEGTARIDPAAQRLLAEQPWPGNLRQLDNIIRRAYTLSVMEEAEVPGEVVLKEKHLRQALGYEDRSAGGSLVELLHLAAQAFVIEAKGRAQPGGGTLLDLDHAEAFKGLVLGTAVKKLGRDEAFRVLGKESLVRGRNHYKALRRELERVDSFFVSLGHAPISGDQTSPFAGLLGPDPEESA